MRKNLYSKICDDTSAAATKGGNMPASAKEFRGEVLAEILRENLKKAVQKGEDVSVKSPAEVKKSLFTIITNAITMSKLKTEAAGYVLNDNNDEGTHSSILTDGSSEQSELNSDVNTIISKIINDEQKNGANENGSSEATKENEEKRKVSKRKSECNTA